MCKYRGVVLSLFPTLLAIIKKRYNMKFVIKYYSSAIL